MASGKLLRQLISSGARGDLAAFRAASEAVIQEERQKKHHLLANDLERLLYADQAAFSEGKVGGHRTFSELPKSADSGIGLMEERPAVREEKDIVLSDDARSIFEEILLEQNRGTCCAPTASSQPRNCCSAALQAAARPWRRRCWPTA